MSRSKSKNGLEAADTRSGPKLSPEHSTQRAARIAVDMAVMNTQYFITLDQFISRGEMFHLQMQLLYTLIDTLNATHGVDPETVLDIARNYFRSLRQERERIP